MSRDLRTARSSHEGRENMSIPRVKDEQYFAEIEEILDRWLETTRTLILSMLGHPDPARRRTPGVN